MYPTYADISSGLPTDYTTNVRGIFTGRFYVATAGTYNFPLWNDDSISIYFDGSLVFNSPSYTNGGNHQFSRSMTVGWHDILIDWHQGGGGYGARLWWSGPGVTQTLLPAS